MKGRMMKEGGGKRDEEVEEGVRGEGGNRMEEGRRRREGGREGGRGGEGGYRGRRHGRSPMEHINENNKIM